MHSAFRRALRDRLSEEAGGWLDEHGDEAGLIENFCVQMVEEFAANSDKGDRDGWLDISPRVMLSEVMYHTGKLTLAVREVEKGMAFSDDKVREFAADTANCALMVADCTGSLSV